MRRKEKSLQKLVRVQKLMHDLAVWRHASIEHEKRTLEQGRAAAIEALGRDRTAYGALGAAAARYARRIETEIVGADERLSDAAHEALRQAARAKIVSEALSDARREVKEQDGRKALAEIADACLRTSKQA